VIQTNKLQQEFIQRYGECDLETYFSPGRVNLIGEHIDYNGGFVLPATISLGITAIVKEEKMLSFAYMQMIFRKKLNSI
jgi:galactokinase